MRASYSKRRWVLFLIFFALAVLTRSCVGPNPEYGTSDADSWSGWLSRTVSQALTFSILTGAVAYIFPASLWPVLLNWVPRVGPHLVVWFNRLWLLRRVFM